MKKEWIDINGVKLLTKCLYSRKMPNGFIVPCGHCAYCRKVYAREMAFRCEQEAFDRYVYNCLITYDEEHLPHRGGVPVLNKVHFQDFIKRFRSWFDYYYGNKVRYLCVGEYGGKKGRPHYHVILFSEQKLENPKLDKDERGRNCPLAFISSIMEEKWQKGACDVEPMQDVGGSVVYLVQYLLTENDGAKHVEPPFRLVSRGKGLGHRWLERAKAFTSRAVKYNEHYVSRTNNQGNTIVIPIPRYYKRKYIPEPNRIASADEYYYRCLEYDNYLKSLTRKPKEFYEKSSKLKELRERERQGASDSYRKRKIHENNRSASRVFAQNARNRKG